jgi:hypothetical protein
MRIRRLIFLVVVLGLTFHGAASSAEDSAASPGVTATPFEITDLSVEGTNLVLDAVVPPGVEQVTLEMRPALDESWQEAASLNVPTGSDEVVFTIPTPATPSAFFRLKGEQSSQNSAVQSSSANSSPGTQSSPLISSELRYVAMPSLGSNLAENGDAIFHFKGVVDGSDKIVITRAGALWNHVNWDWPEGPVTINGRQWDPQRKNYVTTIGPTAFLPEPFSLAAVDLEVIQGRDVVALERADNALIVYLDDTPPEADTYDFKIHFHPVTAQAENKIASVAATLKIAGRIDGSDRIKFTATEARWEHKTYSYPTGVTLNGIPWNPATEPVRKNEGTNQFLPMGIDFSTARIIGRKGRDVATMWADTNALWVTFADNPDGDDAYELDVSFRQ